MKVLIGVSLLAVALFSLASALPEAPTGFDNKTNGQRAILPRVPPESYFRGL